MKINVKHIAKLASLPISENKLIVFEKQLDTTLEHVDRLREIDTSKIIETNEVTNLKNVFREDKILPSLTQEEALQNAKKTYNGFFVVPAILEG